MSYIRIGEIYVLLDLFENYQVQTAKASSEICTKHWPTIKIIYILIIEF